MLPGDGPLSLHSILELLDRWSEHFTENHTHARINSLNHVKPNPITKGFFFQSLNIFIVSMLGKAKSILASTGAKLPMLSVWT